MRLSALTACAFVVPAALLAQKAPPRPSPIPTLADVNEKSPPIAELPKHRLKLTESRRIDGKSTGIREVRGVEVGPRGEVGIEFVGPNPGDYFGKVAIFDSLGRRLWSIKSGPDEEIGSISAFGWRTSDVWIYDQRFDQIALVDHGTVTKSLELPTWIRPSMADRNKYPVFGRVDVLSFLGDGSFIGIPRSPHTLASGSAFDSTKEIVAHISDGGVIDRTIAAIPDYNAEWQQQYGQWRRSGGEGTFPAAKSPLLTRQWPKFVVSWDGARTAIVSADSSHGAVDSVTVTVKDAKGTTVFVRSFAFARKSWSDQQVDSLINAHSPRLDATARADRARAFRRVVPDVESTFIGSDYSVWITLRQAGSRPVVGIDPNGQIIGTLYLPISWSIKGADHGAVWLMDGRPVIKDLVRYTWR
jgi:hypothetical protein